MRWIHVLSSTTELNGSGVLESLSSLFGRQENRRPRFHKEKGLGQDPVHGIDGYGRWRTKQEEGAVLSQGENQN